jgi:hypothetical protein
MKGTGTCSSYIFFISVSTMVSTSTVYSTVYNINASLFKNTICHMFFIAFDDYTDHLVSILKVFY